MRYDSSTKFSVKVVRVRFILCSSAVVPHPAFVWYEHDLMLQPSVNQVWLQGQLQSENGMEPASYCTILDSYQNRVSACVAERPNCRTV
jgi:hypothetical protein